MRLNRFVITIGVDIDVVKSVFGVKDDVLYNQLLNSSFFKKFDEEFSFKKELHDIIFNYLPPPSRIIKPSKLFGLIKGNDGRGLGGEWNDYGFALLTICCFLGDKFSEDDSEFKYGQSWWQINTLLRQSKSSFNLSRMLQSKQILDTPFEYADIYNNIYTKEEVVEFTTQILNIEKEIKEENLHLFNSLKNGLLNCAKKNLDVIVFSHEI